MSTVQQNIHIFPNLRILLFHTLAIDEIKIEIALALKSHDLACANSAKFIEEDGMDRLTICGRQMIKNCACVMTNVFCKLTLWSFRLISNFNGIHGDIFDFDLLGQAELVAQRSTTECSTWLFVLFTWHVFLLQMIQLTQHCSFIAIDVLCNLVTSNDNISVYIFWFDRG